MIDFKNVTKHFPDGTAAVKNISLKVNKGELLALIGPSGCGKTTTMKMINRLITPSSGEIKIHNKKIQLFKIDALRWNIGYVLQEIALFPHLSIAENIAIVPEMKKWKPKEIKKRTDELLKMVNLAPEIYAHKMPSELSGGEQQRVGVVRALAADPDIILMDEPFSALDPISREQLQKDIQAIQHKIKKTIVFVTHDIKEALVLGDRICLMNKGEIIQIDTPENLVTNPKNDFVKDFISSHKMPWLTTVDKLVNTSNEFVVTSDELKTLEADSDGTFVITDNLGIYQGMLKNGKQIQIQSLPHNLPLHKVTQYFELNDIDLLPIIKDYKVIGTLTNKDIVQFLQREMANEDGEMRL